MPHFTSDDLARAIIEEGKTARTTGPSHLRHPVISPRGVRIGIATGLVETNLKMYANRADPESLNFPHDAVGSDANSVGVFQQRSPWWGTVAERMNPRLSAAMFYNALAKLDYNGPKSPGWYAQQVQQSAFPTRYDERFSQAVQIYERLAGTTTSEPKEDNNMATWTGDPTWLEDVLRPELGDRLKTLAGWQNRGHGDFKDIRGVMVHHTGNSRETAQSIANGRPDLAGPLSNIHIAPDGTVTIVAVGVCWHAGAGSLSWLPTNNANWHMIGIECAWPTIRADGSYDANERWPDAQIISMRDVCAALAKKLDVPVSRVIGHKEWAGAAQGKWDPGNLDMNWFRAEVQKDIDGYVFPGEGPVPPQPGPILPPDYAKETYGIVRELREQIAALTVKVDALGKDAA